MPTQCPPGGGHSSGKRRFRNTEAHTVKKPLLVDTHAHLCSSDFDIDRGEVLARAEDTGVCAVVSVSENLEDVRKNYELAQRYPIVKPAAGLYPGNIDPVERGRMLELVRSSGSEFLAIGEVGLDFWIAKEDAERELQRTVFREYIAIAGVLDLPLNVHSRSAGRYAVEMLLEGNAKKVQLHAFDGKFSAARPAVEAGYFFSIPPSIVRSPQKQKLVRSLPLSCLLLESDSPVLGPDPQIRNEPANILVAAGAIAEIKQVSVEVILEAVWENTCRLYGVF